MKKNKYIVPLTLVFSLFFLWAISSNLLPTMIRQLMKTCELNTFEASFTETAYWLAYFIFPIPIAMFMKKYSYKAGIIFGLLLAAGGGLLFFPAAMLKEYWAYLCIFFIIATGMCFLETAANPYVTALGAPPNSTSPSEPGTIVQRSRSVHFCNVPEQADSQRHALYTRNPSNGLSGRLAGVHTGGNGCHEISLSGTGLAVSCHSHGIYVFQTA